MRWSRSRRSDRRQDEPGRFQHEHPQVPEDRGCAFAARDRGGGAEGHGLGQAEGQRGLPGEDDASHRGARPRGCLRRAHHARVVNDAALPAPVTYDDVEAAARRLEGVAHRTPVATSRLFNDLTGAEVFFKCENLQRMGAFKFRGAYNALSQLDEGARRRGVVAFSSGNHAQAVALAGELLGVPRVIVMPADAPAVKVAATRAYGAEVVFYDRAAGQSREDVAERIAKEKGSTVIPPFDHAHVIAGQGTAAKELIEDVGALDDLLVPTGGAGLLSGSAIAAARLSPGIRVIGVEPAGGDDAAQSFRTKTLQRVENPQTIADGA